MFFLLPQLSSVIFVGLHLGSHAVQLSLPGSTEATSINKDLAQFAQFAHLGSQVLLQAATGKGKTEDVGEFNCTAFPGFCQEPFNCQKRSSSQVRSPFAVLATDGKPDLTWWCKLSSFYYTYLDTCINKRDLVMAGQLQYQWSINQHSGVEELDGSYCFIEGHCTNTLVTENTTLEEAEEMCDYRYGHAGWAEWAITPMDLAVLMPFLTEAYFHHQGFHDSRLTRFYLKAACAMGNYHCDVMYCKETYCKNPYYINKYQHLLPKTPGHLIKQHRWHPLPVDRTQR